ncbi:calcium-translocating P-type ATPase [Gautieria morchelliformis]|nr:calcium-translocating P-type ATPase [Gautieria morchelliformis]
MAPATDASTTKRPAIPEISITTSTSNLNSDLEHRQTSQLQTAADDPLTSPQSPPSFFIGDSPMAPRGIPLHTRSPSEPKADPKLLSPILPPILRPSTPPPSSPSASDQGSVGTIPPSPTLSSHSSVHFQQPTTLSLRDNHPGSGLTSFNMLSPDAAHQHRRRGSSASHTTSGDDSAEGTELDSSQYLPLTPVGSSSKGDSSSMNTIASPTMTAVETMSMQAHETKQSSRSQRDSTETRPGDDLKRGNGDRIKGSSKVADIEPIPEENMDPRPFAFNPSQLASLVDPKSLESLTELRGINGLIKGLGTNSDVGLSPWSLGSGSKARHVADDGGGGGHMDGEGEGEGAPHPKAGIPLRDPSMATLEDRKRVYGINVLPARRSKSLLLLMWLAFKDKVLVLLSIAAVVSLALGLFQDFGTPPQTVQCGSDPTQRCNLPQVGWVEGVAIMVAIIIVVVVGSLNDWQKERQFQKLNEKKEDRGVKVIRHGDEMIINIKDVLVGDIALLEPGEIVPCDGVFLRGHNVRCDESGATGESDAIRKAPYQECMDEKERGGKSKRDCFIVSGSKVIEGVGVYVVIAVGTKSFNGRIMMALRGDTENTPLQLKLNDLAELIAKLGTAAGLILFAALMIKFFVQLGTDPSRSASQKAMSFVQILIISVTLIVVAVPEGLPLAVTLALAFATKRMTKAKLLVRVLGSCETMANASVICTDKTGTLTQNVMSVVAGSVGVHCKFVHQLKENGARTNAQEQNECERRHAQDFSVDQKELNSVLDSPLQKLFNEAIAINSTAFEDPNPETGKVEFVGSKTEAALLRLALDLGWENYKQTRERAEVIQMIPFSSERKAMGVVVRVADDKWRLYVKGASEILTKHCTSHVVVRSAGDLSSSTNDKDVVQASPIDDLARDNMSRTIIFYANQSLRTIALCYREFDSWPSPSSSGEAGVPWSELAQDLTLIAITGIEDPLREGVRDAVASCHKAGVTVKMCTGDNVLTARSIAIQCGIYTPGGIIMEGPVFRKLSAPDMLEVVPRLQVLARSSPEDKKILVEKLKHLGQTVAVTGDGTNDGPALKTAHVGFSMGIAGTEVAKEASDIILMDDNFSSIVSAIMWGRCVNDAVRKFLQFQVSVNIAAVIITFITSVASGTETSVLSAVQLLWINIIMDTFAALALATDPASPVLLDRKPDEKSAPLFSVPMRKQILGQSMYQTAIILIFHFAGNTIFGYHPEVNQADQLQHENTLKTLVFNIFVFCQIFNSINCRNIDNKRNIFEGMTRNWYFMGITLIEIGIQIIIVFVGGAAFQVVKVGVREWGISIALGIMSIPIGYLLRLIPDEPVQRMFVKFHLMADPDVPVLPTLNAERGEWNPAINLVRDNLTTFANVRGGRLRSSSFVGKSRSARLQEAGVQLPSLLTMVPSLVASSVGAGWSPNPGSLSDPSNADPSRSSAALWEGKLQIHPDTSPDDPVYKKWGSPEHLA